MFEKRILNIYSVIIGIFFIISGIGKVINTAAFSNLIYQYGLGYLMILSPLIVITEILLGLFLILLINPKRYSLFSFVLLIIFTISFAYAHFKNGVNDCGCFGSVQHSDISPIFSFIRNFILLIMSLVVWIKYPKEEIETVKWKKNLILLVMCLSIFLSGFTFKIPFFLKSKTEIHKFQNQNIKNTELSKYIKTSPDSTYLIFCFTYTCQHCWNSIENLRQYKKNNTVDNVITFATGKKSDKLFFEQNFHPDFSITDLPMDTISKLTTAFPTTFYIEHDTIKVIIQSVLPSPITFNKQYKLSNSK
ncbi:MAG: MauE/DoxX family redox-associated membrane protein [Bacteroidales bacterium]